MKTCILENGIEVAIWSENEDLTLDVILISFLENYDPELLEVFTVNKTDIVKYTGTQEPKYIYINLAEKTTKSLASWMNRLTK